MPRATARTLNCIARAIFTLALLCFVAFHFLPVEIYQDSSFAEPSEGWRVWVDLIEALKQAANSDFQEMIAMAGFVCGALLIVVSPFLLPIFRLSRLAWWIAMLCSSGALLGLGGVIVTDMPNTTEYSQPGSGLYFVLAALVLNFLGFFFIRREIPLNPVTESA